MSQVQVIIPARGGSSRIPGKNIKAFNGAPMIQWPIRAALASAVAPRVVVSTDSQEIADVAKHSGAEVPFVRPAELANDHAGTAPVIVHALDQLETPDDTLVMCLYPTAPVSTETLDHAFALAHENLGDFTVTVGRHRSPWERSLVRVEGEHMALASDDALLTRTQDLPQRFFDAGKFYLATAQVWRERETMMAKPFVPYLLPDWASVDIDEPADWAVAEALHEAFVLRAP